MKKFVFFLGGKDAEMMQIEKILTEVSAEVINGNLGWGAKASAYSDAIKAVTTAGKIPVLIELVVDIELPTNALIIDHHGDFSGNPQSILQVLELIGVKPTREDILIAINDEGYIPGLVASGASIEEIRQVRAFDRSCQGITSEQEIEAERAVAAQEKFTNGLVVVRCAHSKTAPIADRVFETQGTRQNLLILSGDGESNYYGTPAVVKAIDAKFPGGWTGGLTTKTNAFWGGYADQTALENFIHETFCPRVIIFGAPDIEEQRARKIAIQHGLLLATATMGGEKCNPMTAYRADGYQIDSEAGESTDCLECIIFECAPSAAAGLTIVAQCDHHNPGNAGFGLPPAQYLEASSLGQLLKFLRIEPTQEDRVIAAADHCLAAAYAGQCPGVTAAEVLAMRLPEIMKRENVSSEAEAMTEIEAAVKLLKNPDRTVTLGDIQVADVRDLGPIPFLVEAGVMTGTAYLAKGDKRFPDKVNLSGPKPVVAEFLGEVAMVDGRPTYPNGWAAANGLYQAYGDAGRGFAGAYDKLQA